MFRPLNNEIMSDLFELIVSDFKHGHKLYKKYFFLIYGGIPIAQISDHLIQPFLSIGAKSTLMRDEFCPYRGNNIRIISVSFDK